ncbi:MAG: hypothetical protein ACI4YB_13190 [Oscillospiraceae bacterium]
MYCKKCGKENEDNVLICKECGCSLVNVPTEKPKKIQSVWSLIGMGIGAAVVICGIIMIISPDVSGVWIKSYSFGADFYTEIYNATSKVADSNINAAKAIVRGLGCATASIGAFMAVYFGRAAFEK